MYGNKNSKSINGTKTKKRKFIKLALISTVILIAIAGAIAAYLLYFKQPTSTELYRKSIENAISIKSDELYGSFDVSSDSTKMRGEFIGSPNSNEGRLRADLDVSFEQDDVPLDLSAEMIIIGKEDENKKDASEGYLKYNSLTTSNAEFKQNVEDYFSPVINKWVKLDNDNDEDKPTSFEEDGALAAFDTLGVFLPITKLSESDQKIFLDAIDKYNLYQVSDKIENERFKGIESRKVRVSVKKDALLEFEKEVSETLSDDADFEKFDVKFVDQLFGKDNEFSADVYFDLDEPKIIGASIEIDLDEPVKEAEFNTSVDKVSTSILIEYDRKLTIEAPKGTITQTEMSTLLNR